MKFKVAAIQITSGDNKNRNLKRAEELMIEAVNGGAKLLSLPENFSFMGNEAERVIAIEELESGESVKFLKSFATEYNVWILGGSIPLKADNNKSFNSSLLINGSGEIIARYDKIHLFDVNISGGESHKESDYIERGSQTVCAESPFGSIGLSVCYDLRFPELYRELASKGAKIIFVPSAFTVKTGQAHWEVLLRARAIENQCYVIAPGQVGKHSEKRKTYGHSMIIDPWGKVVACAGDEEGIIVAEINSEYQDSIRKSIPCLDHITIK